MSILHRPFVSLLLLLSLLACAHGQDQPAASAASGTAELFIFNDSGRTLIPGNQKVTDNGRPLTSLARMTYVRLIVPAGPHLLRPDPFLWKQEVQMTIEPGSKRYVVIAYKPSRSWAYPARGAPLVLREISVPEAEPLLREMKLQQ